MPEDKKTPQSPLTGGLVRVERLMEIAFILPAAVVVGWLAGAGLDKWLHQHWIYLLGVVLGSVAGFIEVIRLVLNQGKEIDKMEKDGQ
jgi:ATP synthase protein I